MLLFNRFLFQLFREGQGQSAIFKFGMDILFLQVLADVEASAYIAAVAFLADICSALASFLEASASAVVASF